MQKQDASNRRRTVVPGAGLDGSGPGVTSKNILFLRGPREANSFAKVFCAQTEISYFCLLH
jgi:hypothetical protein